MFFEKIDKLRQAPESEKEHFLKVFTLVSVIIITVFWFFFTLPTFFKTAAPSMHSVASSTPQTATAAPSAPLQAPFSQ